MTPAELQFHRDTHDLCKTCKPYRTFGYCPECGLEDREADQEGRGCGAGMNSCSTATR